MFSGLEFCVEFISEVRNAKSAIVFLNININVESCASDGSQNMRPTSFVYTSLNITIYECTLRSLDLSPTVILGPCGCIYYSLANLTYDWSIHSSCGSQDCAIARVLNACKFLEK